VLPDRIELSTSPLPRECSTTELRQRARDKESAQLAPASAAVLATSPPSAQARDRAAARKKHRSRRNSANSGRLVPCAHSGARLCRFVRHRTEDLGVHLPDRPVHGPQRLVYCHAPMAGSKNGSSMQDEKDKQERQTAIASSESRQHRLKLALRENLKRRKSQARGRGGLASSEPAEGRLDDASDGEPGR
jgi:hypothetical protein